MTTLPTRDCRQCGKPLVFARTDAGALIPLDPKALTYKVTDAFMGQDVKCERTPAVMVTHFATCPKASHFTKGKDGESPQDTIERLRKELQDAKDEIARMKATNAGRW